MKGVSMFDREWFFKKSTNRIHRIIAIITLLYLLIFSIGIGIGISKPSRLVVNKQFIEQGKLSLTQNYKANVEVPEMVVAELLNPLDSKTSQEGDTVYCRVIDPPSAQGAIIKGTIKEVKAAGRLKRTASMRLYFDSIKMPDGEQLNIVGQLKYIISSINVKIDINTEGEIQTKTGNIIVKIVNVFRGIFGNKGRDIKLPEKTQFVVTSTTVKE